MTVRAKIRLAAQRDLPVPGDQNKNQKRHRKENEGGNKTEKQVIRDVN